MRGISNICVQIVYLGHYHVSPILFSYVKNFKLPSLSTFFFQFHYHAVIFLLVFLSYPPQKLLLIIFRPLVVD